MTELYRHYDKSQNLLYVGISLSSVNRLGQHKDHSHWFNEISNVTIERFNTRQEAIDAEKKAVVAENPKCNINLRKTAKEISNENKHLKLLKTAQNITDERILRKYIEKSNSEESKRLLVQRFVQFNLCYTLKEIQDHLKMTSYELGQHIEKGNLKYFEVDGVRRGDRPVKTHKKVTGWQFIDFIEFLEAGR